MFWNSYCQIFRLQPLFGEQPTLVSICTVAKNGSNGFALRDETSTSKDRPSKSRMPPLTWPKPLCQLHCSNYVEGRACANVDTFCIQNIVHHVYRVLVRDMQRASQTINECAQIICYPALAYACK